MMQGQTETVSPGLESPVMDSQRIFRAVLATMARPGTVTVLGNWPDPPRPLRPAAASVCLALADLDTPMWLGENPPAEVSTYLRFHCGCPVVQDQESAGFALVLDGTRLPDLSRFNPGHQEYPDRSTTVIIQVNRLEVGSGVRLTGPGIKDEMRLGVVGLEENFWTEMGRNHARYPLGYDVILATDTEIASLPRSVRVEV
ncbi:phosphonate C-P lyase system protein PhnH [Pseudodesulfovibrio cashew]|uniref:Phosphonate C-P lyase system protein PhnH n=1 Tax=Pseudodesulfovibrio cashew TaxID=2678688 RepID=A0A6I6JF92_9BACT|nr:phosphonate C-P lyase system protein PhnH [Pseudodesulfovibrio cashew]QGY39203.1 phosphonate C-P lyase system protein PhnH [Pseudodesulfovibrio cashew]